MPSGLVLSGGAARGAYELGVLRYLVDRVAPEVGRAWPWEVLSGTSVGAIHACALAATADAPGEGIARLVERWSQFAVNDVLQPDLRAFAGTLLGLFRPTRRVASGRFGGALLDTTSVTRIIETIPFERIAGNLAGGHITGVSVSATHVATGRTVVFVQRAEPGELPRSSDPTTVAQPALLGSVHARASAAIPLLFPVVTIDGEHYCDGGLRQLVPLSPALHLGADALVVVSTRHLPPDEPPLAARGAAVLDPLFLMGKALNALFLDRVDADVERLEQVNALLAAGVKRHGPGYLDQLNRDLRGKLSAPMGFVQTVVVRPSIDLAHVAAGVVKEPSFRKRAGGLVGRLLHRLEECEPEGEADLLSYLLFDGEYAMRLIELGYHDASRQHEALCRSALQPADLGAFRGPSNDLPLPPAV